MLTPDTVLSFWLDETSPKMWYQSDEAFDQLIRDKFLKGWQQARDGAYAMWLTYPSGTLAYVILTDQFPRNMFRGSGDSFALDNQARAAAKVAISRGWDLKIDAPARQFFYLPLMHSENLCDQDRCVRLMKERMPENGGSNLLHARVHREIIRKFGRFPYRNDALGRTDTPAEAAFIGDGGYRQILNEFEQSVAA